MPKVLLATRNRGKVAEYLDLLGGLPFQFTSLDEERISQQAEESGDTYEANARLKAEAYAQASGLITLADDSGLEVAALKGEPGPRSARYGGPGLSDEDRVRRLLQNLADVPENHRGACFVCVIAIAGPHVTTQLVRGECRGVITREPRGRGGFGYDPVFFFPALGETLAELPMQRKNAVSHRGNAARAVQALLLSFADTQ